ncbi:DgyrCDS11732 [Dimorphilus gyrociliatus]|uniref:DgyrCDS11732 n=1 Tax=Dimorphilus gyrociliatus TaxID=2664684 RepID=A0A7I8W4B3_9ANNE|nr:DgyrCDS11732 [Dimorphilus gyrociliatus]
MQTFTRECSISGQKFNKETCKKWNSLLYPGIEKIHKDKHECLVIKGDAVDYIQSVLIKVLESLCSNQPRTCDDVDKFINKFFVPPLNVTVLKTAHENLDLMNQKSKRSSKASSSIFPLDKIHQLLLKDIFDYRFNNQITVYFVSILECIARDILTLAGNFVSLLSKPNNMISKENIIVAIRADEHLSHLIRQSGSEISLCDSDIKYTKPAAYDNYDKLARDIVLKESQYLRELKMICKVFKEPIVKFEVPGDQVEKIFSEIDDVLDATMTLYDYLEDGFSVDDGKPLIGNCFMEMIEGEEYYIYQRYAEAVLNPELNIQSELDKLLRDYPEVATEFKKYGNYVFDALIYCLPKMLFMPVYHFFTYNEHLDQLLELSIDAEDKFSLEQSSCIVKSIKINIENFMQQNGVSLKNESTLHMHFTANEGRSFCLKKIEEVQKNVESIESKIDKREMEQICEQFVMEGRLNKWFGKQRVKERYLFLFDGVLIVAKQQIKKLNVIPSGEQLEYRFKEKFYPKKGMDLQDLKDDKGVSENAFKLVTDEHASIFVCKSAQEKNNWMAAIVHILVRSTLDKLLDMKITEEERNQPLPKIPSAEYKFTEEDSKSNIEYDENCSSEAECESIRGATLLKLVEKLTPPSSFNPSFIRTFLTTYRTFCQPEQLLDLLIERYDIPLYLDLETSVCPSKRYRKEYVKPIQMRTLNVLKHWVDQHWYDFEMNQELLKKLENFLGSSKDKSMSKWLENVKKVLQRKREQREVKIDYCYSSEPPPILWHIATKDNTVEYDLMSLHPVELARQVTLLEFDLFKAIKSSEMVGSLWTKADKYETSPNILKAIDFSTRFTYWLVKTIVETGNIEERTQVLHRVLELYISFYDLNNFSGVIEVASALTSASVHRLTHTRQLEGIQNRAKFLKTLEEAEEFCHNHNRKYFERLRNINPPCVPFLGASLNHLLLTEVGNADFLQKNPNLINFGKCRKIADITNEIQQNQNLPYCLHVEMKIRNFLESLNPHEDKSSHELETYFYERSMQIEPRNCPRQSLPKFEKKRQYQLRSPGTKYSILTTKTPIQSTSDAIPSTPSKISAASPVEESYDSRASSCSSTPPGTPHSALVSSSPATDTPPNVPPRTYKSKPVIPPRTRPAAPPLPPRIQTSRVNSAPPSPPPTNAEEFHSLPNRRHSSRDVPNGTPQLPPKTYNIKPFHQRHPSK